jgi:4-amino-4-deoxy-L-arabinose transferase-like glycosyltransferase
MKPPLEKILLLLLAIGLPLVMFYNLGVNPRPWHDEGAALILARTLAEDGVYAMRNSDGYQTFGAVQSVGPTVILPTALSFRLFGVGLAQGRAVAALYGLLAVVLFYGMGRKLFDGWTALLGVFFLLAAPAVRIFLYGREVLGEVPGLALFLGGWLALAQGLQSRRLGWGAPAGLLFGAAILTKATYLLMIPATLGLTFLLDLFYYRQGAWKNLALAGALALAGFAAWQFWQMRYYGAEAYQADLDRLRQLAAVTTGFHLRTAVSGVRGVLGSDSGHFYLYWGIPALAYAAYLAAQRSLKGLLLATVVIFVTLWLLYFMFWIIPWPHYALPAMALTALLIAHLYLAIARAVGPWLGELGRSLAARQPLSAQAMLALGALVGLLSFGLWSGYNLQQYLRSDVLDRTGADAADLRSPPQLQAPGQAAQYLQQNLPPGALIETWERELGILTDLRFHYPDQALLIHTHAAAYRGGALDYRLGAEYFDQIRPDYVVVGWFARSFQSYDLDELAQRGELIARIGEGEYGYEIYRLRR